MTAVEWIIVLGIALVLAGECAVAYRAWKRWRQ